MSAKVIGVPSASMLPEGNTGNPPVLKCEHLGITFGGLKAVEDFNLSIGRAEIAGLIGPNGAGKPLSSIYLPRSISRRPVQFSWAAGIHAA